MRVFGGRRGIGKKDDRSSHWVNDEDGCAQCLVWYVCVDVEVVGG